MRKQELVQLHVLCSQVRRYVERRYDVPEGAFDRYDRAEVPPMAIHRKKEVHEDALDRLVSDLRRVLATHVEGPSESPTDSTSPTDSAESDHRPSREEAIDRREWPVGRTDPRSPRWR